MKKRIFLITLLLLLMLSLVACIRRDDIKDYISSEHKMLYYMPGDTEPKTLNVTMEMGRVSQVPLTVDSVEIDEYHTYAGLYTEPVGGKCIFDANGRRMAGTDLPSSGVLYVHGVGMEITIKSFSYSSFEMKEFGAPSKVYYGSSWPDRLPVVEKEGYTFYGWSVGILGLIAGPDGVVFEQYKHIGQQYIDRGLTVVRNQNTKEIMSLRLSLTPILRENAVGVTYDYNDGSYRKTVVERKNGSDISNFIAPGTRHDGMELMGWSTDRDVLVPYTGAVTGDMTLYAIWREYRYALISDWRGQERIEKVFKGDTLILMQPEREGYTFGGWYDNEECLGEALQADTPIAYGSLVPHYFAKWIPNE